MSGRLCSFNYSYIYKKTLNSLSPKNIPSNHEMYNFQETHKPLTSEIEATPPLTIQSPATPFSTSSEAGCWSLDDIPSSPEENRSELGCGFRPGLGQIEQQPPNSETEIDFVDSLSLAYYWRNKYPDLKGGSSMTRELSEVEVANLNRELSETLASF